MLTAAVYDGFVCLSADRESLGFIVFRQEPHQFSQHVCTVFGFERNDIGMGEARAAMVRRIAQLQADDAQWVAGRFLRVRAIS